MRRAMRLRERIGAGVLLGLVLLGGAACEAVPSARPGDPDTVATVDAAGVPGADVTVRPAGRAPVLQYDGSLRLTR
jgi:hypothetical protein